MIFPDPAREIDQECLRTLLRKLHAASELLERAIAGGDCAESDRLNAARAALERAIAVAESHVR